MISCSGDELAFHNHSEFATTVLKPYVSEKTHWIVEKHGIFQLYYYARHLGYNKDERESYKGHKYYKDTIKFGFNDCALQCHVFLTIGASSRVLCGLGHKK